MAEKAETLELPYPTVLMIADRPEMELYLTGSRDDAQEIHELIEPSWTYLEEFNHLSEIDPSTEAIETATSKTVQAMRDGTEVQYLARANESLVGRVGLTNLKCEPGVARVSYWLGEQHQGYGYAYSAAGRIIQYGFEELGLNRVHIGVHRNNLRSEAVARRLGAHLTPHIDIKTHKERTIPYRRWEVNNE